MQNFINLSTEFESYEENRFGKTYKLREMGDKLTKYDKFCPYLNDQVN